MVTSLLPTFLADAFLPLDFLHLAVLVAALWSSSTAFSRTSAGISSAQDLAILTAVP